MKQFLLILVFSYTAFSSYSQSSYNNNYEDLFIEKNVFTIKSRYTYYSSFPLIAMFQRNKYIKIPITGNLVNEGFEIENCSLYIFDTIGNYISSSSGYGIKYIDGEKSRMKKYKLVAKIVKFDKEKRKMIIKMPLRSVNSNSFTVFIREYRLIKGKYYFFLKYKIGNETIYSNKAILLVK